VLCNILMACYRCFCRIVHGTYFLSHHIAIHACSLAPDSHYTINMEYNSIKVIKFVKAEV